MTFIFSGEDPMALRPGAEIAPDTLLVLLALAPPDDRRPERILAVVREARSAPGAARVERWLDLALGPDGRDLPVAARTLALRARVADGDVHGIARILWIAARTPGLAWRRLEERARRALVLAALAAASASGGQALAAK